MADDLLQRAERLVSDTARRYAFGAVDLVELLRVSRMYACVVDLVADEAEQEMESHG